MLAQFWMTPPLFYADTGHLVVWPEEPTGRVTPIVDTWTAGLTVRRGGTCFPLSTPRLGGDSRRRSPARPGGEPDARVSGRRDTRRMRLCSGSDLARGTASGGPGVVRAAQYAVWHRLPRPATVRAARAAAVPNAAARDEAPPGQTSNRSCSLLGRRRMVSRCAARYPRIHGRS